MGTVIDSHFLGLTAIVTVGYHFLFLVVTALLNFKQVPDFAECANFVIIVILTLILKGTWKFRQIVLTSFVCIWGLRHGLFLLMKILRWGVGVNNLLDELNGRLGMLALASFWILQAVWLWTVSLPVTVVNSRSRNPSLQAADIAGWIMWSVGFLVEATADHQKFVFKNSQENIVRTNWCNVGLWQYSRHPNYFGKILIWWGIFVASTPVLEGIEWLVIVGPIFLTLSHLFITGIPRHELSADARFSQLDEYRLYKRRTSPLIPLPPVVYGNLPHWFKATFLFEFPFYNCGLPQADSNRVSNAND